MSTSTKQKDIAGQIVRLLRESDSDIILDNELAKKFDCNTANFKRARRKLLERGIIKGTVLDNDITVYSIVIEYLHGDLWRKVYKQVTLNDKKTQSQANVMAPKTAEDIIKEARAHRCIVPSRS